MAGEPGSREPVAARLLTSTGGDGDIVGRARDFNVVARGSGIIARALQPHVVAHLAEGLIVEDQCRGDPALEVNSCSDACGTPNGDP